jgi:hypothetical protein
VQPEGAPEPIFGVMQFTAKTQVNRVARIVFLHDFVIQQILLPSAPGDASRYQEGFTTMVPPSGHTISLDRLEAMLAIEGAETVARKTPVKNVSPDFVFSPSPALLIPIDGNPFWQPVQGTSLVRAINTRALVLLDNASGTFHPRSQRLPGNLTSKGSSILWMASQTRRQRKNRLLPRVLPGLL